MTWATDHLFVAGGDYVSEFWHDFQEQAGVGAIITVSPERPPAYTDPAPWAALWLPVDEEGAYTLDQLALGVQFIEAALAAGYKLLLHGPHGVHRTRPLVAAHLIARGKTVARVIRVLEEKPWLPPYKGDVEVLAALHEFLKGTPCNPTPSSSASTPPPASAP
jgi:hypothetical protein